MRTFGLTGGIGMGKSTAGELLERLGCRVVDTDATARELTEPGQPALTEIREIFGSGCFDDEGRLRRGVLARIVFGDETARRQLEAVLHPRIRQAWQTQFGRWRTEGCAIAVAIIPLLFETGAGRDVERTICVACSEPVQQHRLEPRRWTASETAQRIGAQLPIRKKMELADYVVWNDAGMDLLEAQLRRILNL
jgi:dephospho-CoA kinase